MIALNVRAKFAHDEAAGGNFPANVGNAFIFSRSRVHYFCAKLSRNNELGVTVWSVYHLASPVHWPRCRLKGAMKLNNPSSIASRIVQSSCCGLNRQYGAAGEPQSKGKRFVRWVRRILILGDE
jgi:hypothetical protein